jgi:hypothetical protein
MAKRRKSKAKKVVKAAKLFGGQGRDLSASQRKQPARLAWRERLCRATSRREQPFLAHLTSSFGVPKTRHAPGDVGLACKNPTGRAARLPGGLCAFMEGPH